MGKCCCSKAYPVFRKSAPSGSPYRVSPRVIETIGKLSSP